MITKREFIDRVIRKIMDYRSIARSKLYYKEISDENEVIAAIPAEEAIYLKKYATSGYSSGKLTHSDFNNTRNINVILEEFILVASINCLEFNKKSGVLK